MSVAKPEVFTFQASGAHRESMTMILDEQRSAENVELRRKKKLKDAEDARKRKEREEKERKVREAQEAADAERREAQRIEQERKDEIARQAAEAEREKAEKIRREADEQRQRESLNTKRWVMGGGGGREYARRLRAQGEEFVYDAVFKYEGPLGLTFKVDPDGTTKRTLVNEVKADGFAHRASVRTGDHLTFVNDIGQRSAQTQHLNGNRRWP